MFTNSNLACRCDDSPDADAGRGRLRWPQGTRPGVFETKDIAESAYIYGFPMVANYKALYEFTIDKKSGQYKAPFNQIANEARVFTPKDTTIVTPNSDTPYSLLEMDLRAEPLVLCVPEVEKARYYSVQLVDMYTFNDGYIGSRATGNGAGCYMVAGPSWKGATPAGIAKVFRCETEFGLAIYRTQLFNPADIDNVKKVQAGYKVQTLSQFLGQPAPVAAPDPKWPTFTENAFKTDAFSYLNFLLQFCPTVPEEAALRQRFAEIDIAAGKRFDFEKLPLEDKAAVGIGIKDGFEKIKTKRETIGKEVNGWRVGAAFGDRAFYNGDWLLRAAAALAGIYGNDAVEALYPMAVSRQQGRQARWQQAPLHDHLPGGPVSAGERLLVGDHVRRQDATADREPDQPLPDQLADAARHEEEQATAR